MDRGVTTNIGGGGMDPGVATNNYGVTDREAITNLGSRSDQLQITGRS